MFMDMLGYRVLHIANLRTLQILCMWHFIKWVFIYLFRTLHLWYQSGRSLGMWTWVST